MNIINDQKIALRYFKKGDESPLHEYTSDIDSSLYLSRRPYQTQAKTLAVISKYSQLDALAEYGKCIWIISDIDENEAVGYLTCEKIENYLVLHIGIRKKCESRGIASQALKIAAEYWLTVGGIDKVVSYTDVEHYSAKSAFLKAGFSIVDTKESYYIAPLLSPSERTVYWLEYSVT